MERIHCFAALVALQGVGHLDLIAVVGGNKIAADQQQDNVSLGKVLINLTSEFLSGNDPSVMPGRDSPHAFERRKVLFQLITQSFVGVSV